MRRTRGALVAAAAAWMLACGAAWAGRGSEPGTQQASADARHVAHWVLESADHRGLPFAIVDKKNARIYVFARNGRLMGASPALLGQTPGDGSAPLVGEHTQAGKVPVAERTTPAGRFVSRPGSNLKGEHLVWIDYDSALAIHRLRPGASRRARAARLASVTPADNRASLGCVVVPTAFYRNVVEPLLGHSRAVIYVLPEERPVREMIDDL